MDTAALGFALGAGPVAALNPCGFALIASVQKYLPFAVGYAVASISCTVAPFLAVISTTFKQRSPLTGILAFTAYAAGMAITVGVAALAVALSPARPRRRSGRAPYRQWPADGPACQAHGKSCAAVAARAHCSAKAREM